LPQIYSARKNKDSGGKRAARWTEHINDSKQARRTKKEELSFNTETVETEHGEDLSVSATLTHVPQVRFVVLIAMVVMGMVAAVGGGRGGDDWQLVQKGSPG
jgi:hypothetical protein